MPSDRVYSYYPGCSLHASGRPYDQSLRALFPALDCRLEELDDWNCCGATAYFSVKETVAYTISARNLALAEQAGRDLVVPCSACFCVLRKTKSIVAKVPEMKKRIAGALAVGELSGEFTVPVRHPLEVILTDVGTKEIVRRQKRSLKGWRVACYYGCQILRPETAFHGDDPECPAQMEGLFTALGATAVDYPPRTRCCGGMLMATREEVARALDDELVQWARNGRADCIVTTCPLCQTNLDMMQTDRASPPPAIPVLYFTQVLGFALGCEPGELGFAHHLVDPRNTLRSLTEALA